MQRRRIISDGIDPDEEIVSALNEGMDDDPNLP
jgi:hypothetical protein